MVVKSEKIKQYKENGAIRGDSSGKGRYDLIPPRSLRRVAKHFEDGGKIYGDNNWIKGIPLHRIVDSMIRHSFQLLEENTDEDHASAIAWNALIFMETKTLIEEGKLTKDLDDLRKT